MNRSISFGKNKNQSGSKKWVHPSEALLRGHIVYNVKFLGHVEVDQPKGIEVVKEAIRKMKFNKQIKRAEGQKPPKVELTISVDGVTVQEPKYKVIQHQYPLHRISYCADDKSDKRMFTFIAKESDSNKHHCFVFDSDKCAEEITLTIGQAFDLAYKKFIESSGRDIDMKKQFLLLQKKVQTLTQQNLELKERVADLERLVDPAVLANFDKNKERPQTQTEVTVGRRLENLVMDDGPKTNGTAAPVSLQPPAGVHKQPVPLLAPPPPVPPRQNAGAPVITSPAAPPQSAPAPAQVTDPNNPVDLFGATPFSVNAPVQPAPVPNQPAFGSAPPSGGDPFGMGQFSPSAQELDQQIMNVDRELLDLKVWQDSWPWNYTSANPVFASHAMTSPEIDDDFMTSPEVDNDDDLILYDVTDKRNPFT